MNTYKRHQSYLTLFPMPSGSAIDSIQVIEILKSLAAHRKVSVNKLMEELSTQALAEFDSEVRFRAFVAVGRTKKGADVLGKLDRHPNNK